MKRPENIRYLDSKQYLKDLEKYCDHIEMAMAIGSLKGEAKEKMKKKKGIRMNQELIERIQFIADKENRTFGNLVETVMLKEIDELEKRWIIKEANNHPT